MSFWSDVPRVVRLLKGERANYGLGLLALWVVNFSDVTSQQALEMLRVHLGSGALENSGGD